MTFGDIVDQLHDEHRLSYAGTTKESGLSTLAIRLKQVDHFDTGIEYFRTRLQILEVGSRSVNGVSISAFVYAMQAIDSTACNVKHTTFDLLADRHSDRTAQLAHFQSAHQAVRIVHCDCADCIFADMLLHFNNALSIIRVSYFQSIVYFRQHFCRRTPFCIKSDVDDGTNDLRDSPIDKRFCHEVRCVSLAKVLIFSNRQCNSD